MTTDGYEEERRQESMIPDEEESIMTYLEKIALSLRRVTTRLSHGVWADSKLAVWFNMLADQIANDEIERQTKSSPEV